MQNSDPQGCIGIHVVEMFRDGRHAFADRARGCDRAVFSVCIDADDRLEMKQSAGHRFDASDAPAAHQVIQCIQRVNDFGLLPDFCQPFLNGVHCPTRFGCHRRADDLETFAAG